MYYFDLYLLSFSTLLFSVGFIGISLNKKHALVTIMALEIMFLGVSLIFLAFSAFLNDFNGQVFSLFILSAAGAESAIALSLMLVYFRASGTISILALNKLRG